MNGEKSYGGTPEVSNLISTLTLCDEESQSKKKKTCTSSHDESPMEGQALKGYPEIEVNNGEGSKIMITVFRFLDTQTLVRTVRRVCSQWNKMSYSIELWRRCDLSFVSLDSKQARNVIERHCDHKTTRSFSLRAPSPRYSGIQKNRSKVTKSKCLTPAVLDAVKKRWHSLTEFSISYEQICTLDLFASIPIKSLTHLSLAYCNLDTHNLRLILRPDMGYFGELLHLDLTGVLVPNVDDVLLDLDLKLPPKLHTLILRDSQLNLQNTQFQIAIVSHILLEKLDLSLCIVSYPFLHAISRRPLILQELNLCGSMIARADHTLLDAVKEVYTDWDWLWRTGFRSLIKLNLRNLTSLSGISMPRVFQSCEDRYRNIEVSLMDVDGQTYYSKEWADFNMEIEEDLMPEWRAVDTRETTKYNFDRRLEAEKIKYRAAHGRHAELVLVEDWEEVEVCHVDYDEQMRRTNTRDETSFKKMYGDDFERDMMDHRWRTEADRVSGGLGGCCVFCP